MSNEFNYQSECFKTQAHMKRVIRDLKENMCEHFGYNRSEIRLPHGLITLYGYNIELKMYVPLTDVIGGFNENLKKELYSDYYVSCKLIVK